MRRVEWKKFYDANCDLVWKYTLGILSCFPNIDIDIKLFLNLENGWNRRFYENLVASRCL